MIRRATHLLHSLPNRCHRGRLLLAGELRSLRSPSQSAARLAASFAVGTFISFIPVPLLDSLLVGFVLTRFKNLNRAPIFIARLVWNDFLVFPLYGPGYKLGSALIAPLLGGSQPLLSGTAVTAVVNLLAATLVLSTVATSLGYLLFLLGLKLLRSGAALQSELAGSPSGVV